MSVRNFANKTAAWSAFHSQGFVSNDVSLLCIFAAYPSRAQLQDLAGPIARRSGETILEFFQLAYFSGHAILEIL